MAVWTDELVGLPAYVRDQVERILTQPVDGPTRKLDAARIVRMIILLLPAHVRSDCECIQPVHPMQKTTQLNIRAHRSWVQARFLRAALPPS
jgi:hypothetical protein